jgi:MFS transporter, ACS family, glucarate transporter
MLARGNLFDLLCNGVATVSRLSKTTICDMMAPLMQSRKGSRFRLLRFAFILSIITYIDRVCISTAAPAIRQELGLSTVQVGWMFSVFTFAYAFFEIPSGWLADVMGPRKMMTRIVIWWSAFTAATGLAWNFSVLLATRFLFGVGEAGAFPTISRSFSRWFPRREVGNAHGVLFMGTRFGGALAPPLVVAILTFAGWRVSFFIFGALGVIWSVFWWKWYRDDPHDHGDVTREELEIIRDGTAQQHVLTIRWREFLNANLLLICLMYFCVGYAFYFYLTWLPTYLKEARGFSTQQAGLLAGLILFVGGVATAMGGRLTDFLVRRYGLRIGRSIGVIAMPASGAILLVVASTGNRLFAAALLAIAAATADLCVSACWTMCHDVAGDAAGTATGCMNTFGNLGGAISPLVVGYAVQWWGSWSTPLIVTATVCGLCGLLTLMIDPTKRLKTSEHALGRAATLIQSDSRSLSVENHL